MPPIILALAKHPTVNDFREPNLFWVQFRFFVGSYCLVWAEVVCYLCGVWLPEVSGIDWKIPLPEALDLELQDVFCTNVEFARVAICATWRLLSSAAPKWAFDVKTIT